MHIAVPVKKSIIADTIAYQSSWPPELLNSKEKWLGPKAEKPASRFDPQNLTGPQQESLVLNKLKKQNVRDDDFRFLENRESECWNMIPSYFFPGNFVTSQGNRRFALIPGVVRIDWKWIRPVFIVYMRKVN